MIHLKKVEHLTNGEKTFALDIGTRTIVGIILEETEKGADIKHYVVKEHRERAMLDGQIHDVISVAKLIDEVKHELEKKCGPLTKACVAAAGRTLKTEQALAKMPINGRPLQKQDIIHLELMAVQKAQQQIAEKYKNQLSQYFCVGYSVIYYYLDGEKIGNLLDQNGSEAAVEIIATFLPKMVVDSLSSALNRAQLEMEALTLEPIAAIHVLIPPSMRRLNVALVDIGAGTSDIAITDKGTITNYGMVSVAGDEITEAISDQLLIDFPIAEQVKRELSHKETITVKDILGFEHTFHKEEIIQEIIPSISQLAETIADEILRLNHNQAPKAVMLVGGGSLTPKLPELIAEKLQLPKNRVAIRKIDAIENVTIHDEQLKGPEFITPIGIGIAAKKNPLQYKTVYVNKLPVHLFEIKPLTVGDSLLAAGIKLNQLYGRPGLAKIIHVNGKAITISGKFGNPPKITLNGTPCSLDDSIHEGDQITVEKGKDGESRNITVEEFFKDTAFTIMINGKEYQLPPNILVNEKQVDQHYILNDRDVVEWHYPKTIQEALERLGFKQLIDKAKPFVVTINQEERTIPEFSGKILKNGIEAFPSSPIQSGDKLTVIEQKEPTVKQLADSQNWILEQTLPVTFNGEPVILSKKITSIYRKNRLLTEDEKIANLDQLIVKHETKTPFIYQDIFRFVDYSLENKKGSYQLLKNNQEASFLDPLAPHDQLEIKWSENK